MGRIGKRKKQNRNLCIQQSYGLQEITRRSSSWKPCERGWKGRDLSRITQPKRKVAIFAVRELPILRLKVLRVPFRFVFRVAMAEHEHSHSHDHDHDVHMHDRDHPEDPIEAERNHLQSVLSAFTYYRRHSLNRNHRRRRDYMSLSEQHKRLIPDLLTKIDQVDRCIEQNMELLREIVKCTGAFMGIDPVALVAEGYRKNVRFPDLLRAHWFAFCYAHWKTGFS